MVDVLKSFGPAKAGGLDEGKTIQMNQCFANRNEEDELYPLTLKQCSTRQWTRTSSYRKRKLHMP
jgi:hypothetical protein